MDNVACHERSRMVQEIAHSDLIRRLAIVYSSNSSTMNWSPQDIMMGLYIAVAVMLIVVLYHVMFIVVDVRKIMRRLNNLTEEVEAVVMKPLSMTDQVLEWMIAFFQEKAEKHKK